MNDATAMNMEQTSDMTHNGVVITESNEPLPAGVTLPIYMDNHATTPMDPRVLDAMLPYFGKVFGNAASRNHQFGWEAEQAVDKAREQIAKLIGCTPKEIIFHLRRDGVEQPRHQGYRRDVPGTRQPHHHAGDRAQGRARHVQEARALGLRVTYLPVETDGLVSLEKLTAAMTDKTILVTIMYANNEIGVVQPVQEIGKLCHEKGIIFHTDAVQAVGKIPVNVQADNIDVLSLTAHKIYGPKGVGALYVRRRNPRVQITEQINGGGHERGMRSGTLNVPGIVGLGAACEIAGDEMAAESARQRELRDYLKNKFENALDYVHVNGNMDHHLPGNLNMSFVHVEGESLLMGINDIAVSSGSACTSATLEPSYVLKALGLGDDVAHCSIRFGLGRFNTRAEVDYVSDKMIDVVHHLREMSPLYEMVKEGIDLSKIEWAAH